MTYKEIEIENCDHDGVSRRKIIEEMQDLLKIRDLLAEHLSRLMNNLREMSLKVTGEQLHASVEDSIITTLKDFFHQASQTDNVDPVIIRLGPGNTTDDLLLTVSYNQGEIKIEPDQYAPPAMLQRWNEL